MAIQTKDNESEKTTTPDRVTYLIFQDIRKDINEIGVREYIEYGIKLGYYLSIEDGINALYQKSIFYSWLIDIEDYETCLKIKTESEQIKNDIK